MSGSRAPLQLALVWHMHQPDYVDPASGERFLPWTRLHALKDYADMAEHLARHPRLRATFNVVPALLTELVAYRDGTARPDPFLALSRRRVDTLRADDRAYVVGRFFALHRPTMAKGLPRLNELAALRGDYPIDGVPSQVLARFDDQALLDLEVLFHLAWSGPLLSADPQVAALRAKGRSYTEEDKQGLLDVQASIESNEATELKKLMSGLKPDAVKPFIEGLNFFGSYTHGTHVAGIATAGNPAARLMAARITFDHRMIPELPTREQAEREAASMRAVVKDFKQHGARVVNMSWGGSPRDIESAFEANGAGGTPDERKKTAREYFELSRVALTEAMREAPEILFVAAGRQQQQRRRVRGIHSLGD